MSICACVTTLTHLFTFRCKLHLEDGIVMVANNDEIICRHISATAINQPYYD